MTAAEQTFANQITSSVESGVSAAAAALNRTFDLSIELEMGEMNRWDPGEVPTEWNTDGVSFLWRAEAMGALLLIPDSIGLFPPRDAEGRWTDEAQSQMAELAGSLAKALGAQESAADHARAFYASPLLNVVTCAQLSEWAAIVSLNLKLEDFTAVAHVVGPVMNPGDVEQSILGGPSEQASHPIPMEAPTKDESGGPAKVSAPAPTESEPVAPDDFKQGVHRLPRYTRSLLRISVPLSVTLAAKKQRLLEVMNLVPGSIIQFNKSWDAALDLEVANQKIAVGEVVKVGDNFGLRVTSVSLPGERFRTIRKGDQQ